MPADSMTIVTVIVAAYLVFMLALVWAWHRAHEPRPEIGGEE